MCASETRENILFIDCFVPLIYLDIAMRWSLFHDDWEGEFVTLDTQSGGDVMVVISVGASSCNWWRTVCVPVNTSEYSTMYIVTGHFYNQLKWSIPTIIIMYL